MIKSKASGNRLLDWYPDLEEVFPDGEIKLGECWVEIRRVTVGEGLQKRETQDVAVFQVQVEERVHAVAVLLCLCPSEQTAKAIANIINLAQDGIKHKEIPV